MKTFYNLLLELSQTPTREEGVQRHYEHAGDVAFNNGMVGARSMAKTLSSIVENATEHLATKIDGSPSMEYGVENGRHWISYKGSKKKSFTHEDIEIHHSERGSQGFRDAMHSMLDHVHKIHNGTEGEVHQGDIMWHEGTKPTVQTIEGKPHYTFKANVIRNAIPVDSEEGRRIQDASFGFAPHTLYRDGVSRNFSHVEEQKHPDIHLFDSSSPSIPEEHKPKLQEKIGELHNLIGQIPEEHFSYISQPHIADWSKRYTSTKRMSETQDKIGFDDFRGFVHGRIQKDIDKLKTQRGKEKAEQSRISLMSDMESHRDHIESGLKIHTKITNIGNDIRSVLDSQHGVKRYFDLPNGEIQSTNPEGYVFKPTETLDHSWYKLVDPSFTARNFAVMRRPPKLTESVQETNPLKRTGSSDHAVVSFGRGMGHIGHMALAGSVIHHAKEVGADPYVILSRTTGDPKNPLTVDEKLAIHREVFPETDSGVFQPTTTEMPNMNGILPRLYEHGYKHVTVITGSGEDNEKFQYVREYNGKVNKKTGKVGYDFDTLRVIPRQETNSPDANLDGPRATDMRDALTDPSKTEEERWGEWRSGMHPNISDERVRDVMSLVRDRLSQTKNESVISRILRNIFEEGEGVAAGMSTNSNIAGLGDDAREGNVIVQEKPKLFKRFRILKRRKL